MRLGAGLYAMVVASGALQRPSPPSGPRTEGTIRLSNFYRALGVRDPKCHHDYAIAQELWVAQEKSACTPR